MQQYAMSEHFTELKTRILKLCCCFIITFIICYHFKIEIFNFLLLPITELDSDHAHKIIYTGLSEAFFTYLKLASYTSLLLIMPVISYQIYNFIAPGLHKYERQVAIYTLTMAPILFWLGSFFVFYYVMPKAWQFFLSFEQPGVMPIVLEARISEYLSLVVQLIFAFGMAFQLPIVLLLLNVMNIVSATNLSNKRRLAIVIIFIIAGILTPPDILSQFALAIPMVLLYEISIKVCKLVENRGKDVRY